jgi:hypothetical protein
VREQNIVNNEAMNTANMFRLLYERAMRSTRGGPLFNAFPYPTKISPEAIAWFIAAHTAPGATVLDGL